jgi:hypothetical protein
MCKTTSLSNPNLESPEGVTTEVENNVKYVLLKSLLLRKADDLLVIFLEGLLLRVASFTPGWKFSLSRVRKCELTPSAMRDLCNLRAAIPAPPSCEVERWRILVRH